MLLNHGSRFDADQILNYLPAVQKSVKISKNPEQEEGRRCILQPGHKYANFALRILQFIYAMSRRMNKIMRDCPKETTHMDLCQGKALFETLQNCNVNTAKGRYEIHKLVFDKEDGAIGGIYEDMKHFGKLYPETDLIFKKGMSQLKKGYAHRDNQDYHHLKQCFNSHSFHFRL